MTQVLDQQTSRPASGAEALALWKHEGITGVSQDRPDSPESARQLREQVETERGRP
jgi:hypothetical protein